MARRWSRAKPLRQRRARSRSRRSSAPCSTWRPPRKPSRLWERPVRGSQRSGQSPQTLRCRDLEERVGVATPFSSPGRARWPPTLRRPRRGSHDARAWVYVEHQARTKRARELVRAYFCKVCSSGSHCRANTATIWFTSSAKQRIDGGLTRASPRVTTCLPRLRWVRQQPGR